MTYFWQRGQTAWWLSGVLALGAGALGWLFFNSEQHQQQLADELRNAQVSIASLERESTQAQGRETELNRQLSQLQSRISGLDEAGEQITQLRAELNQALEQKQSVELQIQQNQTSLSEREQQISNLQQESFELKQQLNQASQLLTDTEQQLVEKAQQALLAQREVEMLNSQRNVAATTEQRYLAAREQLALREAQNENHEETVARLQRKLTAEASAMAALENSLQKQLLALNQEKQQLVSKLEDGTTAIRFPESILFASGSAVLNADGKRSLAQLTTALDSFPDYLVSVQGHSDSRSILPPTNLRYPTNWELSGARAAAAVRHLVDAGVNKERLQAVGYADARPLLPETSPAHMQKNRRIEVILIPNPSKTRVMTAEQ